MDEQYMRNDCNNIKNVDIKNMEIWIYGKLYINNIHL